MSQHLSPSDFKERVRELAREAGVEPEPVACGESHLSLEQCWVDARVSCPFGKPEGQYILRPEKFCDEDCPVYFDNVVESELEVELKSKAVHEHFEAHKVSVVSELRARTGELPEVAERLALHLAADLIEEKDMDRSILLEDDLPGEQEKRREAVASVEATKPAAALRPDTSTDWDPDSGDDDIPF